MIACRTLASGGWRQARTVNNFCSSFFRLPPVAILSVLLANMPQNVQAAEALVASGFLTGFAWYGTRARQTYTMLTHAAYEPNAGMPGGIASFGIPDGGPVMLLTHARYVPSLLPAAARRNVMTATPPLDARQLPRFIMICVWPLQGDKPGEPQAGYAERDDANIADLPGKYFVGLTVNWQAIPASRAPAVFAKRDYCGEIAKTGKSSAPLWLLDRPTR